MAVGVGGEGGEGGRGDDNHGAGAATTLALGEAADASYNAAAATPIGQPGHGPAWLGPALLALLLLAAAYSRTAIVSLGAKVPKRVRNIRCLSMR